MTQPDAREAWIGRSIVAEDVVSARLVDAFQATLAPILAPSLGDAPLGIHWCLAPPAVEASAVGEDGHPAKGSFLPPVALPRRMWAESAIEFFGPLGIGDQVRKTSTIEGISDRTGRTGVLTFVTVLHDLEVAGRPVMRERQVIVYREAAATSPSPSLPDPGSARPEMTLQVETDPVLLFRYSALTFNGHRIHYDRPYAMEVEGYSGLVVHGPLQATILLNLAAKAAGRVPRKFSFRGLSPAICPQVLNALAMPAQSSARELRIDTEDGRTTMKATAEW